MKATVRGTMAWGAWLTVKGVKQDVLLHYQSGINQAGFKSGDEIPTGLEIEISSLNQKTLGNGAVVWEAEVDPAVLRAAVPAKWEDGETRTTTLTRILVAKKPSATDTIETEKIAWVFDKATGWRRQDGRAKRHPWDEPEDQTVIENDWDRGRCAAHLYRGW